MKNKNSVRGLVILGIVLATWLVIVLAVPFVKNGAYWLSFVFTLIAFLAQLHIFKISFRNGESVRSKFYGFPIARLGVVYLAVQLVLGLLVMALAKWVPTWVGVILFAVTLAAAAVGCSRYDARRGGAAGRAAEKGCLCHARHAVQGQRAGKPVRCTGAASRTAKAGGGLPIQRSCQQRCAGGCGDVSICLFGRIAAQSHRWRFGQCSRPLPPRRRHPDGTKPTVQAE